MTTEILINVAPRENRAALIENGVLTELFVERQSRRGIVSNLYTGRVQRVLPGMQAAFIDVGLERTAFLHAHALAGAQVERHARPAPVVDLGAQRDEGFRVAVAFGTGLLVVARHGDATRAAGGVLATHRVRGDSSRGDRTQTAHDLGLLIAHLVRLEQVRRLHGHQRDQLQQVVLHDVAQRASIVVVAPASFEPDGFRDSDLHVVDGRRVPQRLEQ